MEPAGAEVRRDPVDLLADSPARAAQRTRAVPAAAEPRRRRIVRGRRRNRDGRLVRCRRNVGERRRGLWRCGGWRNGRLGWSRWERGGRGWRLGWRVRERRTGGLWLDRRAAAVLAWCRTSTSPGSSNAPTCPGPRRPTFDDSSWDNVGLPHSFSLPYFMASKFYVGYGWYRKHFSVPSSWIGQERVSRVPGRVRSGRDLRQRQEGRRAHRRLQRVFDRHHLRHQDRRQRRRRSTEQQVERADSRRSRAITPSRAGSIETCSSSSPIRCTSPGTAPGSRRPRWRRTRARPAPWRSRRRCRTTARPPSTPR